MAMVRLVISRFKELSFLVNVVDYETDEILTHDVDPYDAIFHSVHTVVEIGWWSETKSLPAVPNGLRGLVADIKAQKKILNDLREEAATTSNAEHLKELTGKGGLIRKREKYIEVHRAALAIVVKNLFCVEHHDFQGLI
jgi:hypothetical protein